MAAKEELKFMTFVFHKTREKYAAFQLDILPFIQWMFYNLSQSWTFMKLERISKFTNDVSSLNKSFFYQHIWALDSELTSITVY